MQLLPLGTQAALIYNTISRLPSSYNRYVYKQEMFQGKTVCAILNPVIKIGLLSTRGELGGKKSSLSSTLLKTFVNMPLHVLNVMSGDLHTEWLRLALLTFLLVAEVVCTTPLAFQTG